MFKPFQHRGWHYALLLTAGAGLFLVNLGGASLWDLDEGRNSTCSLQMWISGDWIIPYFNGKLRVDKPVLLYWLQCLSYSLFGVNEFAARFPSALAACGTMLLCYELGRSLFGKTTGLLAGLIAGSTPMICGAARFANPDSLLNFCIVLTMYCYWHTQGGRWYWYAAMGAASGLAVLAKGPVGLVLPVAAMGLYAVWTGQLRDLFQGRIGLAAKARRAVSLGCFALLSLFRGKIALATVAFLVVALPWYIWVGVETKGEFLYGFLIEHNVRRATSAMEKHDGGLLFYPLVLILGTTPWSIFLGLTAWNTFRMARQKPVAGESPPLPTRRSPLAVRFLVSWFAAFFFFFSLSATKLPNYILPITVPFALLTAQFLICWCRGEIRPAAWMMYCSIGFLFVLGFGTGVGMLIGSGTWPIFAIEGQSFPGLERGAILGLLPLIGAGVAFALLRRQCRVGMVWVMTLTSLAFIAPLAAWAGSFWNEFKAARPMIEQAQLGQPDQEIRIFCWDVDHLPSLNFYARRDIVHCEDRTEALACLEYPTAVYLILPAKEWETLKGRVTVRYREIAGHHDFYHNERLVVVTNR